MPEHREPERQQRLRCIFVIGPEGSGGTYAARLISKAIAGREWAGHGFNCCDAWDCDRENGFVSPCRPVPHLVCHRSVPFAGNSPPIDAWRRTYDCAFVLCTRDKTIAQISSQQRFGNTRRRAGEQNAGAAQVLADVLGGDAPCFIWSYETLAFLGPAYFAALAAFLGVPADPTALPSFRDENSKYVRRPLGLLWNRPKRWLSIQARRIAVRP